MKNDWQFEKIGNVATPVTRAENPVAGKVYRQIGVRLWGEGAYERETIDGSQTRYPFFFRVETDDIVVNKIWARNGSVAIVPKNLGGGYVSSEFPTFTPIREKLEPRWFHWITKTKNFWERCDEKSRGTSGKNRIRPEQFLQIEIPLPPLPEQQRIVARIEELARRVEEARGLRKTAVEESNNLVNVHLSAIVRDLETKYETPSLDKLLIEAGYGTSVKCESERINGATPVLRIPNVASEKVTFTDLKYGFLNQAELKKTMVHEGDLLIVRTNGSKDLVGRCAVVPTLSETTSFASYMIRIRCNSEKIAPHFLQLILRQQRTAGQLIDFARTTAGQYNVSLGRLRNTKIPLPPIAEQHRLVAYLDSLQQKVDELRRLQAATQTELDALLPSILAKAFAGEL
jgi:type I restriction enzyme S subunit